MVKLKLKLMMLLIVKKSNFKIKNIQKSICHPSLLPLHEKEIIQFQDDLNLKKEKERERDREEGADFIALVTSHFLMLVLCGGRNSFFVINHPGALLLPLKTLLLRPSLTFLSSLSHSLSFEIPL